MSPLELRVKDTGNRRTCRTADCIMGRRRPRRPTSSWRGLRLRLLPLGRHVTALCSIAVRVPARQYRAGRPRAGAEPAERPPVRDRRFAQAGHRRARNRASPLEPQNAFGMTGLVAPSKRGCRARSWRAGSAALPRCSPSDSSSRRSFCLRRCGGQRVLAGDRQRPSRRSPSISYALVPFGRRAALRVPSLTGAFVIVPVTQRAAFRVGLAGAGRSAVRLTGMRPIRASDSGRFRVARHDGVVCRLVPLRRARLPDAGGTGGDAVAPRGCAFGACA